MMKYTINNDFEEMIEQYRPSLYNGTVPVSSLILEGESALLRVETASMAAKVTVNESIDEDITVRQQVTESLEKSIQDHSAVWEELSKH